MALVHLGGLLYNRAMPHATKSALQDAREAFIAGLARRADALRPVVESFIGDPGARGVRAEVQRRLHSLLASAQLFEEQALASQLQTLTSRLDAVGLDGDAWEASDSDLLLTLLSSLDPQGSRTQVSGVAPAPAFVPESITSPSAEGGSELPPGAAVQVAPVAHLARELHVARVAQERSERPPEVTARPEHRPPALSSTPQLEAVAPARVLLVCSRPHAAELRALLHEAPIELLHAADPEQAVALLERSKASYALVAAEFATLPDIDLVARLRQDPQAPVDGVYLMLPSGATYDGEFLRQTGADGVLLEPISWEMLGPLLDRATSPSDLDPSGVEQLVEPSAKLSLEGGLSEAFAQAQSAAAQAHRAQVESARVPKAASPVIVQAQAEPARPAPPPHCACWRFSFPFRP